MFKKLQKNGMFVEFWAFRRNWRALCSDTLV